MYILPQKSVRFNRGAALRLSLYFGNSPEFLWMNLQTHYDLPGEILMQKTSGASRLNGQLKARQSGLAAARCEEHHKEVAVRT